MNKKLDRGVLVGGGLVAALLMVNAVLNFRNTQQLNQDADGVAHTHQVLDLTGDVLRLLVDAETGQRGFIITGQEEFLQPYHAAVAALPQQIARLKEKTKDNERQQARIKRLREMAGVQLDSLKQGIDLRRKSEQAVQDFVASMQGRRQMDSIRDLIAEMEREEHGLLQERERQTSIAYQVAVGTSLFTSVAGVVLVVAFVWLHSRSLLARAKAAAVIQREQERFRVTLASIGDGVMVTDGQGKVTFMNAVAQTLTGWSQDALGRPLVDVFRILNEETGNEVESPVAKVLREGMVVGLANHTILIARDGARRPIDDSAAPIREGTGPAIGVVLVFRDVTERRDMERIRGDFQHQLEEQVREQTAELRAIEKTLSEKNLELEKASQAKDRFLATMSHELRTPLNAIIGFTGTLLMKLPGPLNEDQEDQLRTVESSATHLLSLINDLLDLAKIESGKLTLKLEPVSCQKVVKEVITTVGPLAEGKRLRLEVQMPPGEQMIRTDRRALTQILLNLANNAIKFTETGAVSVRMTQTADGQPGSTQFSVTDSGIGIRPDDQDRLFRAFEQVEGARRHQEGTGLGLHLSQKLAHLLGGQITFTSEFGKGSTFTLELSEKEPQMNADKRG